MLICVKKKKKKKKKMLITPEDDTYMCATQFNQVTVEVILCTYLILLKKKRVS